MMWKRQNVPFSQRLSLLLGPLSLMLASLCLISCFPARGGEFPSKTIQIVVPYQPGGPSDITPRLLTKRLSERLGQSVIVINREGGGTAIGSQAVLTAPADGHTILAGELSVMMLPFFTKGVNFSIRDFTPINLSTSAPLCLIVNKDSPFNSVEDIVAAAKSRPGELTYSTAGPGSIARFAGELFQIATGTTLTQIPMNGASPAITAVLGGQVDFSFMGVQATRAQIEAGALKGLAVLSDKRYPTFPDIPAIAEKGFPTVIAKVWTVFLVPKNTPPEVVARLGAEFNEAYDAEARDTIAKLGFQIENLTPDEAKIFLDNELEKWTAVIKSVGIEPR